MRLPVTNFEEENIVVTQRWWLRNGSRRTRTCFKAGDDLNAFPNRM
jgi:hypothetical protein